MMDRTTTGMHDRLQRVAGLLKALRQIGRDVTRFDDRDALLEHTCGILRRQGQYRAVWILLQNADGDWRTAAADADHDAHQQADPPAWLVDGRLSTDLQMTLELSEPHCIRQNGNELLTRRMESEDRLYGILVVADRQLNRRGREELQIFAEIADDIADALWDFDLHQERRRERAELQHRYHVERSIVRISCLLTRSSEPDRNAILGEIGQGLQADRVSLFTLDQELGRSSCSHEWCAPGVPGHRQEWQGLAIAEHPWWMQGLRSGTPLVIDDRECIRDQAAAEYAILAAAGIVSLVALPITTMSRRLVGFISVQLDSVERSWQQADVDAVRVVAEMLSSVAERLHVVQELQRNAADLDEANRLLKEQQSCLLQMQKMEAIGQLAAGVAHEINTPIQFIGDNVRFLQEGFEDLLAYDTQITRLMARSELDGPGLTALLGDAREQADLDYLAEEVPQALSQTLDGVGRVATIVQAMKEFAHPGDAEMAPADLNRAIESTVVVSRNEYKYCAELELDLASDLEPVPCDIGAIKQVLLNLIINAAHAIQDRYGDDGRGRIHISTRQADDAILIRLSDDGCGIPEEIRERIFEPFFTTKEVGRGSGQGLALIQRVIAQQHRGLIDLDSTVGVGSTFTLHLPLHLPADIRKQLSVRSGAHCAIAEPDGDDA